MNGFSAGMYGARPFMIPSLHSAGMAAAFGFGKQAAGFFIQQQGGESLRQTCYAMCFAQQLGPAASLGLQVQYLGQLAQGYDAAGTMGYTLSSQLQLATGVQALASLTNLGTGKRGLDRQVARYQLGIAADVSDALFLGFNLGKTEDASPEVLAALQYQFGGKALLRAGLGSGSSQVVLGIGYFFGPLRLDVYSSLHTQLGLSPGLQLVYQPIQKK